MISRVSASASPSASPLPGRSSQARAAAARRSLGEIGQILQQSVQQCAASEPIVSRPARSQRRGRSRHGTEFDVLRAARCQPFGSRRLSREVVPRANPALLQPSAADRHPAAPKSPRTPRQPALAEALHSVGIRHPVLPGAARSRARSVDTSTELSSPRRVCHPQTSSRSSARVSAT